MTDLIATMILLEKNNIDYRLTDLYNNKNDKCGQALWLNVGHIEFDNDEKITNVVNY